MGKVLVNFTMEQGAAFEALLKAAGPALGCGVGSGAFFNNNHGFFTAEDMKLLAESRFGGTD